MQTAGGWCILCVSAGDAGSAEQVALEALLESVPLWTEVYKAVEVAQWLDKLLEPLGHCVSEVHADLNPNPEYLSNCVASMCLGYIKSMGFSPVLKPNSWCADAADDKSK